MTAPLFLADAEAVATDPVVVTGAEARHAVEVRRIRVGEQVLVGDGRGVVVSGVVTAASRSELVVDVAARRAVPAPQPRFVVVQALAKGGRDADAVEAMTEVGVDELVPWAASRCVARWTERVGTRWAATAREAAKQARRAWVPEVVPCAATGEVEALLRRAKLAVVLHEAAEAPLAAVDVPAGGEVVVVVGPEGGLTDDEIAAFAAAGAPSYRLGDTVLRTSTAGVAALSVLLAQTRWR